MAANSLHRDWQKLIFYYYADHYVNFKDLVNDLYKLYKVRLWMSAVNPASFSPNAINQPPTGIGPGALTGNNSSSGQDFDNSYTMSYGTDPDPYGAVPPYQIPYNTYNPNYPAIPGINSSFAPAMPMSMPMGDMYQQSLLQHVFGMPNGTQQGSMQPIGTPASQHALMQPIGTQQVQQGMMAPMASQTYQRPTMQPVGTQGLPQGMMRSSGAQNFMSLPARTQGAQQTAGPNTAAQSAMNLPARAKEGYQGTVQTDLTQQLMSLSLGTQEGQQGVKQTIPAQQGSKTKATTPDGKTSADSGNGQSQGGKKTGTASRDFGRLAPHNTSVDWDALGMFRR